MPDNVLLNPDNRLLGGATSDFGLFGGQPTTHVSFTSPDTATPLDNESPNRTTGVGVSASGKAIETAREASEDAPTASPTPDATTALVAPLPIPAPTSLNSGDSGSGSEATPAVPSATGSSSAAPQSQVFNLSPASAQDSAAMSAAAPPAADFASALTPVTFQSSGQSSAPGANEDSTATELPGYPQGPSASVVEGAVDRLENAVALGDSTNILGNAASQLADAVGNTADVLGSATAQLQDAAGQVKTVVGAALNEATHTSTVVADVVEDSFEGLAGADPAGGVATLLGLVESNEMAVIGPATDIQPAQAATSVLDSLTADVPIGDALLGDHGQEVANLSSSLVSATDHHDDGLLGGL